MAVVRGRFAPSPTGEMHLGNAWSALLAWIHALRLGGHMILRMEDLDPQRSRPEYADLILQDLAWLGLTWEEGPDKGGPCDPYRQSECREIYEQALMQLRAAGWIYSCFCSRADLRCLAGAPQEGERAAGCPGHCWELSPEAQEEKRSLRQPALRVHWSAGRGRQDLQDFVMQRADGVFSYQLAVVVDDGRMAVNQVVRGHDLLASVEFQTWLQKQLGFDRPQYIHVPLLVDPAGHRLSKRHADQSLRALRHLGYKAEDVVGYLAWKAGQQQTRRPMTAAEMLTLFRPERVPTDYIVVEPEEWIGR